MPETKEEAESKGKVLNFWFGNEKPNQESPFQSFWFHSTVEDDDEILQRFGGLWDSLQVDEKRMKAWEEMDGGRLALIILFDQMPRNMFRGEKKMFETDSIALRQAIYIVDHEKMGDYAPVEWMFILTALQHAEDLNLVKRCEEELKKLVVEMTQHSSKLGKRYRPLLSSAKGHVQMIEKFGRYSHRNAILGRESTIDELDYLATNQKNFVKSVKSLKKNTVESKSLQESKKKHEEKVYKNLLVKDGKNMKPMKILVFHGFRQNSHSMNRAFSKLVKSLKGAVQFQFINSPQTYVVGTTPFGATQVQHDTWEIASTHQKTWWNASDDGSVYRGWEVTVKFLERVFKEDGPFDGVIGFSQGATLIGVLAGLRSPIFNFRYAINVSGGPSRALDHKKMQEEKVKGVKTMNIYGKEDTHLGTTDVMKKKTLDLAALFEDPLIVEHPGGHFTPGYWPIDEMASFILEQQQEVAKFSVSPITLPTFAEKYAETFKLTGDFSPVGLNPEIREKVLNNPMILNNLDDYLALLKESDPTSEAIFDDLLLLSFAFREVNNKKIEKHRSLHDACAVFVKAFLSLYSFNKELFLKKLEGVVHQSQLWRELQYIAVANHPVGAPNTQHNELHHEIVRIYSDQIKEDARKVSSAGKDTDPLLTNISNCALYLPKPKQQADRVCHLVKDIAYTIRPIPEGLSEEENKKRKLTTYIGFQKDIRSLVHILDRVNPNKAMRDNSQIVLNKTKLTPEERQRILDQPPNGYVLHPEEMPVLPFSSDQFEPLIKFLHLGGELPDEKVQFTRGTIIPHGEKKILDLCKNVVGPEGIAPLLDGLIQHKGVTGLLLGNNITGTKGAVAITNYMLNPNSQITTWYIAGNQFGPDDIKMITAALKIDSKVKALWLKRNPLLPAGTAHVADLLSVNSTLETLDLTNCGVLDEGAEILFKGLANNKTLRNLYLNTNGLTVKTAKLVGDYLESNGGDNLESLHMLINPLGDKGAIELARGITKNSSLKRLALGSCAIGKEGIDALVTALNTPLEGGKTRKVNWINFGFGKGTYMFNGLANYLGDYGVQLIAQKLLPNLPSLRFLDINHNQVSPLGLRAITTAMVKQQQLDPTIGLTGLLYAQFGQVNISHMEDEMIQNILTTNRFEWGKASLNGKGTHEEWLQEGERLSKEIENPPFVDEILSVYRTKD